MGEEGCGGGKGECVYKQWRGRGWEKGGEGDKKYGIT